MVEEIATHQESVREHLGIDEAKATMIKAFVIGLFIVEGKSLAEVLTAIDKNKFGEKERLFAYFASGSFATYRVLAETFATVAAVIKSNQEPSSGPLN